jgi:hypothetical protein
VKGICSPRTRKQCRSGLHIWSRNWSKYSCARINGHSKNFSNPLVAKAARTAGPALATASRNCDQSRSRHRTSIVTASHLHTTQSPISAYATIKCIKKTHFFTLQPCLLGAVLPPTGAHTCAPVHYTGAHVCAPVFSQAQRSERACSPYRRALVRACQTHRRALVRACSPHRRALVRACSPHRRAPRARLKFPSRAPCAFIQWTGAHVCAPSTESPAHVGPHPSQNPLKPLYGPPYLPCPKIGNLFLCRMIRPLT